MSTVKTNRIEQVGNTNLPVNLLPVTVSAWLNYNALTNSLIDSLNVTSIIDNGTGDFTANFSDGTFSNTNYVYHGQYRLDAFSFVGDPSVRTAQELTATPRSTTQFRFKTGFVNSTSHGQEDGQYVGLTFFGGQ